MIGDRETLSRLNIVRVGGSITDEIIQGIEESIVNSYKNIIKDICISTLETPFTEEIGVDYIDAYFLTNILKESCGDAHTLGVTDMDLKTKDEDEFYDTIIGGKNPENNIAVVSTKRLAHKHTTPKTLVERAMKVSVHEVGHNLGLTDHMFGSAPDGNLCPMSKGDEFNKFGLRGYVKAIVGQRGFKFCRGCQDFLERVYGAN